MPQCGSHFSALFSSNSLLTFSLRAVNYFCTALKSGGHLTEQRFPPSTIRQRR